MSFGVFPFPLAYISTKNSIISPILWAEPLWRLESCIIGGWFPATEKNLLEKNPFQCSRVGCGLSCSSVLFQKISPRCRSRNHKTFGLDPRKSGKGGLFFSNINENGSSSRGPYIHTEKNLTSLLNSFSKSQHIITKLYFLNACCNYDKAVKVTVTP